MLPCIHSVSEYLDVVRPYTRDLYDHSQLLYVTQLGMGKEVSLSIIYHYTWGGRLTRQKRYMGEGGGSKSDSMRYVTYGHPLRITLLGGTPGQTGLRCSASDVQTVQIRAR